jgi:L-asparaginase
LTTFHNTFMRLSASIATVMLVAVVPGSVRAQAKPPAVHVIGTGGTIGSTGNYWNGSPTRIPIAQLLKIPGLERVADVSSEQLWNVGSGSIGPARWLELSRHVSDMFRARPDLAGIVITHGTDTMEETAYFLDLTVDGDRPVVVTGSMRPADMPGADGPANLYNAVRAAADPATRNRGTVVLMDDRLFAARDVTKTNSTRVETFQAPERGALAIVDPEGIFFNRQATGRTAARFDISTVRELPRVDVIYSYAGADSIPIDALVDAGTRGIVVAGVGRGGTTPAQATALGRAMERGVIVVVSTRTGSGRVPVGSRGDFIGSGDLNPQKARVLLSLVLTRTSDPKEVARYFDANQ